MKNGAIGDEDTPDIRKNNVCLINLMGQHFLSRILDVSEDRLTISFPGKDYPPSGMHLDLQFHDSGGFNSYHSQVVAGPLKHPGVVVIKRPKGMDRKQHRHNCRVTTDLTVQIKEQNHVRRYDAALINLSAGGALVETDAPVDFNSAIQITLSVPRDKTRVLQGHVMHVDRTKSSQNNGRSMVGVRFVNIDSETAKAITDYVWQRLRESYPGE